MEQKSSDNPQEPVESAELPHTKPHARTKFMLAIAVLVLLVVSVVIVVLASRNSDTNTQTNTSNQSANTADQSSFAQQYLRNCKQRSVAFTATPVPLAQMGYLEPMGKVSDGHVTPTDHVYVAPLSMRAADNTTDVVMPADGTITSIAAMPAQYIGDRTDQKTASEDHRITIVHNCQYVSIFIHVHALSDKLKAALGNKALEPNSQKEVSIDLKAGDLVGKIGGNPVDWSLMDAKQTLQGFVTPSLYSGESWKIHVIDPISVYTGDLKQQLAQKSLRSVEPLGGKIDYDKKGALVGNWFREGTKGYSGDMNGASRYWDGHLSIVPDYIDPSATVASLGSWQGKAAQFTVRNAVDPAMITSQNGPVKYELVQRGYATAAGSHWSPDTLPGKGLKVSTVGMPLAGTLLVQVLDDEKLKIEQFPGKSAAEVSGFTDKAQMYYR